MTTKNKRKAKKRETIKQQKSTAISRDSLYFSNRKLYYKIQSEEMKLNLKYQKQKHFKARVKISNIRVEKKNLKKVKKEFKTIPTQRIRKQVAINYRADEEPYFISIRAITINPDISERGLLIAVKEARQRAQLNYEISHMSSHYTGYETKVIPASEDKILNDYKVHIEILIKKRTVHYTL